ncbi:MAG: FAD-dependent oxidoreductase [Gammaproteobacteria bacterium]|nr:FAD-dependent oxidoreductase [Gammaproteobacteria bacterium]
MAKTPLLSALKKLFADHRTARSLGIEVEQLQELRRQARAVQTETRRDFLRYSVVGAVALTLPLARPSFAKTAPRIAIVGAGIAGLTCAYELRRRGIQATVYEASDRVGGRMFSSRADTWDGNQVSEWGGELIDSDHTTIRSLTKRFNLPLDNLLDAQPKGSDEVYHFFGRYYSKKDADRDFSQIFAALTDDTKTAGDVSWDSFTPASQALDRMTVHEWIDSRVAGRHSSPLGQLLDVAYAIEYGADTIDQSALNLIYLLGSQPDASGKSLSVFGESDERFHIRGGNDQLPKAIAKALGEQTVRHNMALKSVSKTGNTYRLAFDGANDVETDFVVLALPFTVLRELDFAQADFDERKVQAIRELGAGHSAKLQLQFSQRLWRGRGPWPGRGNGSSYADTGYQATWEVTRAQPGKNGILTFFLGGKPVDAMVTDTPFGTARQPQVVTDAERTLKQAEIVFPGLTALWSGKATQSLWHLNPLARCSYAYYRAGQYTQFGGYEKVRQGGVLFCGEHTSGDFQGYMEGGASEGKRAAAELAKLLRSGMPKAA